MQTTRLVIIDEHRLFREGLRALFLLESNLARVVGEASTVQEALVIMETIEADVVAVDVSVFDVGIAAIRQIRSRYPEMPILALSNAQGNHVVEVVQEGAHGYLSKSAPFSDLMVALDTVSRGGAYIHPRVASSVFARLRGGRQSPREGIDLTERERDVIERLSQGCSNTEIARELFLSASTIKSTLRSLFGKFAVTDRTHLVATAVGKGFVRRGSGVAPSGEDMN